KDAQDAHEAIRPTAMDYEPERVASYLDKDELALYTLIWNRFVASQMESAVYDATAVDIEAGTCRFRATGQILKFDGFIRVYTEGRDDEQRDPEEEGEGQLPPLAEGDRLSLLELVPEQHFTQPPPRFMQATLVKELEEKGIGRPSTYASIVGTILNKEYVLEDDQRRLKPTELGFLVTDLLVEAFPDVLNVEFTAGMEDQLDRIEEGEEHYVDALRRFWGPFAKDLEQAEVQMRDVKREERPTDLVCEKCGQPMVIKWGRRGEFRACSRYPACQFVAWDRPLPEACPRCGTGFVTEKLTKRYGTVRRCVKEGCGWQEQIDTGDGGDYAPLPERRAAAQVRGRGRAGGRE